MDKNLSYLIVWNSRYLLLRLLWCCEICYCRLDSLCVNCVVYWLFSVFWFSPGSKKAPIRSPLLRYLILCGLANDCVWKKSEKFNKILGTLVKPKWLRISLNSRSDILNKQTVDRGFVLGKFFIGNAMLRFNLLY